MGRLFWKLFLAIWLAQVTAAVGVGSLVSWYHREQRDIVGGILVRGPAALSVGATASVLRQGGPQALRDFLAENEREPIARVYAVDEQNHEVLGRPLVTEVLEQVHRMAREGQFPRQIREVQAPDGQAYTVFMPAPGEGGLGEPPPFKGHRPPPPKTPPWPLTGGAGLLTSLAFSAWLARYLSKPIRHLRSAFAALSEGRLETRVGAEMGRRRDELADLGRHFDHMAERLEALMQAQRRLLHDVSHELRSPLARLQAAAGLARQRPSQAESSLDRIEREAGRLDALLGEVLTLSRLEAGMPGSKAEAFDLGELIEAIVEDARFESAAKGVAVVCPDLGEIRIQGHAELIYRAIENLVRNAVKHSPPGSGVTIEVKPGGGGSSVDIAIIDQGPGVPEGQLASLFEPFFRVPAAGIQGFGLGLAIARRAVEAHRGSIRVSNRPEGGFRVDLSLPMAA